MTVMPELWVVALTPVMVVGHCWAMGTGTGRPALHPPHPRLGQQQEQQWEQQGPAVPWAQDRDVPRPHSKMGPFAAQGHCCGWHCLAVPVLSPRHSWELWAGRKAPPEPCWH